MRPPFKQRLQQPRVLLAPGIYDAFSALIAEQTGFEALYLSGASNAYARLHQPQTTAPRQHQMPDFDGINEVIGTPQLMATVRLYQEGLLEEI